ncbi:MAG: helix-turn-helix transcriptional regulator [Thermoplasmata archaeon]
MVALENDSAARAFAGAKRTILLELKRAPRSSLEEIANAAGISKAAALVHLQHLESNGWVERSFRRGAVGRPAVCFRLSEGSRDLFPQNYAEVSQCALGFIEQRLGRPAVVELLQSRAHDVADRDRPRLDAPSLGGRVEQLAHVRTEEGYMAEVGARRASGIELREHNCPILALAGRYPEACETERRMFESLLRARVSVSHRVVAGDGVCRFWIRGREEGRP